MLLSDWPEQSETTVFCFPACLGRALPHLPKVTPNQASEADTFFFGTSCECVYNFYLNRHWTHAICPFYRVTRFPLFADHHVHQEPRDQLVHQLYLEVRVVSDGDQEPVQREQGQHPDHRSPRVREGHHQQLDCPGLRPAPRQQRGPAQGADEGGDRAGARSQVFHWWDRSEILTVMNFNSRQGKSGAGQRNGGTNFLRVEKTWRKALASWWIPKVWLIGFCLFIFFYFILQDCCPGRGSATGDSCQCRCQSLCSLRDYHRQNQGQVDPPCQVNKS